MADPQAPQTGAPQGVTFDFSKAQPLAGAAPQAAQPSAPAQAPSAPQGVTFDFSKSQPLDPQGVTGEAKGDTGATIIAPKDGESFTDTVKRATDRVKQHPDDVQKDIAGEMTPKNVATKTAETLGAAATAGAVGPALLAAPGEIGEGLGTLYDVAMKHLAGNVLPDLVGADGNLVSEGAAKQTLLKAIPNVKRLIELGIGYEGAKHLFQALGGGDKKK